MIVATIPARHSAHTLLGTLRWLEADPAGRRVVPRTWPEPEPMDLAAFRAWFSRALGEKLAARDPRTATGRKTDPEYQWALRRDAQKIVDWTRSRRITRGSGLETPEGRRAAPGLHDRMRSRED